MPTPFSRCASPPIVCVYRSPIPCTFLIYHCWRPWIRSKRLEFIVTNYIFPSIFRLVKFPISMLFRIIHTICDFFYQCSDLSIFVGPPTCVTNVMLESANCTSITFTWAASSTPGVKYRVMVCSVTDCMVSTTAVLQFTAVDLSPNTDYNMTVESLTTLPSGECVSKGCITNTATGRSVPRGNLMEI